MVIKNKKFRFTAVLYVLVVAVLAGFIPLAAIAAPSSFRIEQAQAEMPRVDVWLATDEGDFAGADISARLGNVPLSLAELRPYDQEKDATAYYIIVDVSTSITSAHMAAVREALAGLAESLGPNDTITLITFGLTVDVLLNREKDAGTIIRVAADLRANQNGTLFYEALAKAQELASNSNNALERKLSFVFSDADDYARGSTTKDEVDRLVESGNLPFFALGFDNGSRAGLDYFGAMARTSGGAISIVSARTTAAAFEQMLESAGNAWLASFDSGSNIVTASTQELIVTIDSSGASAVRTIPTLFWQTDNDPPVVVLAEQLTPESIRLQFSKPVAGATSPESYAVMDSSGDLLGIRAAAYDDNEYSVVITFSAPPRSGVLTVECPGLTDVSMERNRVAGSVDISFSGTDPEPPAIAPPPPPTAPLTEPESTPIAAWIFICIFAAAIITAVVVGVIRRGKKKDNDALAANAAEPGGAVDPQHMKINQGSQPAHEMQVHFATTGVPPKKVRLNVTDASGQGRSVEVPVNKTLFVGRSDICDVYFDDNTMSRQHFVIGEENGVFTVTNLSESGGTLLNGVALQKPRPLQNGDTIKAGQQTIVFFSGQ